MTYMAQNFRLALKRSVYLGKINPIYPVSVKLSQEFSTGLVSFSETNPLVKKLLDGLKSGNRASLAESITLVETTNAEKKVLAKLLLSKVLHLRNKENKYCNTFRIGLSGPPGAGKSTFIEYFGKFLTNKNKKVAVLAVDPSSATTGGSILGDKTRMINLSRDMNAYIRPSPSQGHLGGVTRSTNESIVLCEAAGYDVVIVETIGVGQSEFAVADMVDLFALIMPPGAGDELQGIKKGIMELSDIIVVNKSDGDLIDAARRVQYEYISALKYIRKENEAWKPVVHCVSSIHGYGIEELWTIMMNYKDTMKAKGSFEKTRMKQQKAWMWTHLKDNLMTAFLDNSVIKDKVKYYEKLVLEGAVSPGDAADIIFKYITETFTKLK